MRCIFSSTGDDLAITHDQVDGGYIATFNGCEGVFTRGLFRSIDDENVGGMTWREHSDAIQVVGSGAVSCSQRDAYRRVDPQQWTEMH